MEHDNYTPCREPENPLKMGKPTRNGLYVIYLENKEILFSRVENGRFFLYTSCMGFLGPTMDCTGIIDSQIVKYIGPVPSF